jgi:hypothetical protein
VILADIADIADIAGIVGIVDIADIAGIVDIASVARGVRLSGWLEVAIFRADFCTNIFAWIFLPHFSKCGCPCRRFGCRKAR